LIHQLRRTRRRITINSGTANAGMASAMNRLCARQPSPSNAPPRSRPAMGADASRAQRPARTGRANRRRINLARQRVETSLAASDAGAGAADDHREEPKGWIEQPHRAPSVSTRVNTRSAPMWSTMGAVSTAPRMTPSAYIVHRRSPKAGSRPFRARSLAATAA